MKARRFFLLILVVLAVSIAGPTSAQESANAARDGNHARDMEAYRIGPEDVIEIAVWNNAAMSKTVPVRPDGKISLPLLNDVQAASLTPLELRDFLMKRLADYMPNPEVSVIVAQVLSFKVSVLGEVVRPGRHELKSRTTVLDIIALTGGFTQFAARSRIVILRREGDTLKRIPFNYNRAVSGKDVGLVDKIVNFGGGEQENFYLQNGDTILVP